MKRSKGDYAIQTVTNALRLLEQFQEDEELGVTELSRRLSLHKNNVFRLLATLEQRAYVEQCRESDRYRLGVRCVELGHSFARGASLVRRARPILEELARNLGESSHLGVLDRCEVVHLDGEQPDAAVVSSLRIGKRVAAHCTALGKVLLACSPPAVRERFDREWIQRVGLERYTAATIRDRDKFFEHLRTVGGQGFAVDSEEYASGLCCASAPVHDATGALVGALSVSGPAHRLDPKALMETAVPAVVAAAGRLSRELGFTH